MRSCQEKVVGAPAVRTFARSLLKQIETILTDVPFYLLLKLKMPVILVATCRIANINASITVRLV